MEARQVGLVAVGAAGQRTLQALARRERRVRVWRRYQALLLLAAGQAPEAVAAALGCGRTSVYGYQATGRTVPLLRAELHAAGHAVGARTVRRMLHRLGWRFVLVDDPALKAQLAPLYRQGMERLSGAPVEALTARSRADTQMGRMLRSGLHLVRHFAEVPLLLVGFGRTAEGSGIYPALQNAMLAARAEGVGSTLTGFLQAFFATEVMVLLGVPKDAGWHTHGVVAMGYPLGRWGVGARKPVHEVAARNSWQGDLGFTVPEPLWPRRPG